MYRNGCFSGFDWIFIVAHSNPILALSCKCIDWISGNAFIHVSYGSLIFFFTISALNVDHADTHLAGTVLSFHMAGILVNFTSDVLAQIQGSSEHGTDYWCITSIHLTQRWCGHSARGV